MIIVIIIIAITIIITILIIYIYKHVQHIKHDYRHLIMLVDAERYRLEIEMAQPLSNHFS